MRYATVPQLLAGAARRFGAAPAVVTAESTLSFAELLEGVAAMAAGLRTRGVRAGDRILMAAGNSAATVQAWLGAIYTGALPALVNPQLTEPELAYLKQDLEPVLTLLGEAELAELPAGGQPDPHPAGALDPAAIVYTSGTTSRPKGVLVRHAAYTETGLSFPGWIGLAAEERLWACLPLFHINAQAYSLMSALAHGYALALSPRFHASTFWREAAALEVTSVNVVGAMLAMLERQPVATWQASRLRTIYAAPAPRTAAERAALEERFGVRIVGGYGMSENTFGCAESPTSRAKPGSIGRPRQPASGRFANELRVVDPDSGAEVAAGVTGELRFRNPVLTAGYWRAPDLTAQLLEGGWLHTGDAGLVDADGDVTLAGRYKEMIRRRGENIAPGEVEDALLGHPAVAAAAAFGVPSELSEDEVVAAVVLRGGQAVGEDELRRFAARSLAPYKVPSRVVFRESLPMTPTQRVARDALRREYSAGEGSGQL
ncbi:MAG: ATP-dependent acyl-CoA ligase [Chloroflexi bacterium]|nr:MAG: ATP-dependent acyl-CoA ligase [Chloroflexota bacterium]